jgi:hypothetical protein
MTDWHSYFHGQQRQATVWIAILGVLCAFAWGAGTSALGWAAPWWLDTPAVFGFYGLLSWVYEHWLWRTGIFKRMHGIPDLTGRYRVIIRTSFDEHTSPKEGTAVISQSWTRFVVRLETEFSTSRSQGAWLAEAPGAGFCLTYVYGNTPRSSAASVLTPHEGTAIVMFDETRRGNGTYYTGRGRMNHGELTFEPLT